MPLILAGEAGVTLPEYKAMTALAADVRAFLYLEPGVNV